MDKVEYKCENCGEILRRKPEELPPAICNYCHRPMPPAVVAKRNQEVEKRFAQENRQDKSASEEIHGHRGR